MVFNDNIVVSLFIFLAILGMVLVIAFFSLFDLSSFVAAAVKSPVSLNQEQTQDPLSSPDILIDDPGELEVETVKPAPINSPKVYPVPSIVQPEESLFAPSVGERQELSLGETARLCAEGYTQPRGIASCLYWEGYIRYPVDYIN